MLEALWLIDAFYSILKHSKSFTLKYKHSKYDKALVALWLILVDCSNALTNFIILSQAFKHHALVIVNSNTPVSPDEYEVHGGRDSCLLGGAVLLGRVSTPHYKLQLPNFQLHVHFASLLSKVLL